MTIDELKRDPPSALFALWWLFEHKKHAVYIDDGGGAPEKPESVMDAYKHFFDVDGIVAVYSKEPNSAEKPVYCFEGLIERGNDQGEEVFDGTVKFTDEVEDGTQIWTAPRVKFDAWFENELLDEEKCKFFVDFYCGD